MRRAALLLAVFAVAGCGGSATADEPVPAARVKELANVLELRGDFQADAGTTRLLILLSPT